MGLDPSALKQMIKNTERQRSWLLPRVVAQAKLISVTTESSAQYFAPWVDRTGDARRELNMGVEVDERTRTVTIYAQHGCRTAST